jgi:hypothetical protein
VAARRSIAVYGGWSSWRCYASSISLWIVLRHTSEHTATEENTVRMEDVTQRAYLGSYPNNIRKQLEEEEQAKYRRWVQETYPESWRAGRRQP